ncbi:MAG: cupin domain-containing protein [Bacteroidota bacterium]
MRQAVKPIVSILITSIALLVISCNKEKTQNDNTNQLQPIFPKGELGAAQNFTGRAWNIGLVANDSVFNTVIGNVYFEPGARSNWHVHPSGQILIITDGVGFHQTKGGPKQILHKGDVVKCPPNVEHWHGASPDTGMLQMYILPKTENGIVKWLQPVTAEEYDK